MARAAKRKSMFTDDATLRKTEARNSELEDELENALGQRVENMDESEQLREIVEPHGSQSANESMGPEGRN
jgi:hypothetical protein